MDEVPRLLKRQESGDGDLLLPGWASDDAAEAVVNRSEEKTDLEENDEGEEGHNKVNKKTRKVKKAKKEKKEKKTKKERKEKKKSKSKSRSKSKNEEGADDDGDSILEIEAPVKSSSSLAHGSTETLDFEHEVGEDEVLSAIKLATKKKEKVKKTKKIKKKDQED